jgi:phenylpropionate dioxygenase-like ring-hydroxylating dioxygenase large terminal subunit
MDLIYGRLPILAGLSGELPKPGDFKTIDMVGKPVLITRLADGSVKAMLNVCKHRAMLITDKASGNCARFTCPYHGWTYANDGRLISVTERDKFGDVDKTTLGLTPLPVYERAGLIFVVLTPGLEVDFDGFLGGLIEDLDRFAFQDWHYGGSRTIFGANWKVAYDGYLEGYHFAAAHPDTIAQRTFSNVMHFEAFGPHMRIGFPQRSIVEAMSKVPREQWADKETQGYDFVRTIFPNVSIFVAPELTQIAQLLPGPKPNENRTILYYVRRNPPQGEEDAQQLHAMIDWIRDVVNEEDYGVGLKVQRGLESGATDRVIFGRNERGNQYFHRWVSYYLADAPTARRPEL